MTHGSLFSGIGGFELAAEWMGWTNVFSVEVDAFCQSILNHHFPQTDKHGDIYDFDATVYQGEIDIITAGFPCQPFSVAGVQKGTRDGRYLWPETIRVVREVRPTWVVAENVRGLINWSAGAVFDTVCAELENEGFEVFPVVLGACTVNAPHRRERIFIVAHSKHNGHVAAKGRGGNGTSSQRSKEGTESALQFEGMGEPEKLGSIRTPIADTDSFVSKHRNAHREDEGTPKATHGTQSPGRPRNWDAFPTQPAVCGGNDGIPESLDGITFSKWRNQSIKGFGNAIVPQVALEIFKAIEQDMG